MLNFQQIYPSAYLKSELSILIILSSCITTIWVFRRLKRDTNRVQEPPCVPAVVPVPSIGHIIGLIRRRLCYFSDLAVTYREPIAKISILGTNVYIVSTAKMVSYVQRQPRMLSSRSWFAKFVSKLVGCSERSLRIFEANLGASSQGEDSLLLDGVRTTKRILNSKTGAGMNNDAAKIVSSRFEQTKLRNIDTDLDLFAWVRHEILHVVSETAYGLDNPFWNPDVETAFWAFEEDTLALCLTNFLPKYLASKFIPGIKGREVLVKAIDEYFRSGGMARGSAIVNAHYSLFEAQLDHSDIARFECASALGSFANTVPTSFWTIFHIFADAKILAALRKQVASVTTTTTSTDEGISVHHIDLRRLRTETMMFSTVEETSRYRATGIGVRLVTEDTVVGEGDKLYHLKKGSWLVISNEALHFDKNVWGEDANEYVAERFTEKTPHLSFRGFGNGASACCGKNLALYHIASFVAILIMRYDISPIGGVWEEPGQDGRDTAAQVAGPVKRPKVKMTLREDPSKVTWKFNF